MTPFRICRSSTEFEGLRSGEPMPKALSSVERLILGCNPLTGYDHYLSERPRNPERWRTPADRLQVMKVAFQSGAQGFNFNSGPEGASLLSALKEDGFDMPLGLYPMVPDGKFFGRLLSGGSVAAISMALEDLGVGAKMHALARGGWAYLRASPEKALRLYLEVELDRIARAAPSKARVRTILVHELVTDTALSLNATEVITAHLDALRAVEAIPPGFVTRNPTRFLTFLRHAGVDPRSCVIMTPANSVGFQMTPSKEAVEAALAELNSRNVIAMSLMAGGMIHIQEALSYAKGLRGVSSVAIGVSTPEHARTTFRAFGEVMAAKAGGSS